MKPIAVERIIKLKVPSFELNRLYSGLIALITKGQPKNAGTSTAIMSYRLLALEKVPDRIPANRFATTLNSKKLTRKIDFASWFDWLARWLRYLTDANRIPIDMTINAIQLTA